MIVFAVTPEHRYTIDPYLESRYAPRDVRVDVRGYDELLGLDTLPVATWIFTDVDRLTPAGREVAALAYEAVERHPGARALNDPAAVLLRPELLRALEACGINDHRAAPLERMGDLRFPIFVREAHEHTGSLTDLLHDAVEARSAVRSLRWRGYRREDLLAVEYRSASDGDGLFHRSSAFVLGGDVLARSAFAARQWMVKTQFAVWNETTAARELEFVRSDGDAEELREVARIARIDYGRIDYAKLDDRVRVWEVNLNPVVLPRGGLFGEGSGAPPGTDAPAEVRREWLRREAREEFFERFNRALAAVDTSPNQAPGDAPGGEAEVALDIPDSIRARARRERRPGILRRGRRRLAGLLRRFLPRRL